MKNSNLMKRLLGILAVMAFTSFALPVVSAKGKRPAAPYRIAAVRAMLFYDTKGTFSRDVLAAPPFAFWNTVIGEGDAEAPSSSTFVVVEISRPAAEANLPNRRISFNATAKGRVVLNRTVPIGLFGANGKYYAGFWLYDTGCQPVTINVRILGQAQPAAKTATIPFACGE
jgi:hypothetical protein